VVYLVMAGCLALVAVKWAVGGSVAGLLMVLGGCLMVGSLLVILWALTQTRRPRQRSERP